jgi:glutamyl-tRNA reductase
MSLLVVGISHRTAQLALLERVALDDTGARQVSAAALAGEHVSEVIALTTCNRVEVYADVATFHGGLADLGAALAASTGVPLEELTEHLYVHYEDQAVAHLFTVVCGLDSMAVGEGQILGQVRLALRAAQEATAAGRVLGELFQQALRVGKRAHAETDLDSAGRSIVQAGIEQAAAALGGAGQLGRIHVLVVGAGSMSSLAAVTAHRAGAGRLTIANRTRERATRLAGENGAAAIGLPELPEALAGADLVISCTGSVGHVIDAATVAAAQAVRGGRPQAYLDLALPRDIDPAAADLPGVQIIDLDSIGRRLNDPGNPLPSAVAAVRGLIAGEVAEHVVRRRSESVAPTVVALRARAAEVVAAELARFEQRRPDVDPEVLEELRRTVNRVVEKLLHAPTVRVKELAGAAEPSDYAAALRELFDLDPHDIATVSTTRLDEVIDIGGAR